MRRMLVLAISAIALVFLASLVLLDQMGEADRPVDSPPAATTSSGPSVEVPPSTPSPPAPVVAEQLRAPPTEAAPLPPPSPLPESGVPPAPAFVRDGTAELQRFLSHRCGAMKLRLGDDLRQGGGALEREAVLLVEAEPQRDQLVFGPSRLQTQGLARGSLVACVQLSLRGHVLPISRLQPGERITVQVVIGVAGE